MPQREKPRLTIRRPPPPSPSSEVLDSFVDGALPTAATAGDDAPKDGAAPGLVVSLPEALSCKLTDICVAEGIDVDAAVLEAVSAWIEADPLPQRFDW